MHHPDFDSPTSGAVPRLKGLVSPEAETLYFSLLVGPRSVPASNPARRELITQGLARVLSASGEMYALPPEIALTRALHRATERWLAEAPSFDGVTAVLSEIGDPLSTSAPAAELVTQTEKQTAFEALLLSARRSVYALQPFPEWIPDEELADQDQWVANFDGAPAEVTHRFIYDQRLLRYPAFHANAIAELSAGTQIRLANWRLPTFLAVVDERVAGFFPQPRGPGTITRDVGTVGLLTLSFEAAWDRSVPLRNDAALSEVHLRVHTLVSLGHNNRTIASILGMHERTVRRRINELMDHYGLPTRNGLIRVGATDD